jgi:Tfp pilus assembly protein PilX
MTFPLFKKYLVSLFCAPILLLSACAGVPVQEMSDARQALDVAREAAAGTDASKELRSAETLLQSAEQALQEGDYKRARKNAQASRSQSVQAQDKSLNEE